MEKAMNIFTGIWMKIFIEIKLILLGFVNNASWF